MWLDNKYCLQVLKKQFLKYALSRRTLHIGTCTCVSHYDVLGITPKATQNDIKSAYYKLSKLHHPDITKNEDSANKFRSISAAYEVLGNIRLKKIYDKGLLVGRHSTTKHEYEPEPEPTDPTLKFYKSRTYRQMAPTMGGRQTIYDFDTWSKNHYGDLFKKAQYEKVTNKKRTEKFSKGKATNQEAFVYTMIIIGGFFIFLVTQGKDDYDTVTEKIDNSEQKQAQSITH